MEKILEKKMNELNIAKMRLAKRAWNYEEVKEQMKYLIDDIELILQDLGYINRSVRKYTLDEVAKYTGENGGIALVIINGTVYDVTHLKNWRNGKHFGVKAGCDLTSYFEMCHNNEKDKLNKCRIVGVLAQK